MSVSFLDGKVTLHSGDCLDVIRSLADASIDSIVTDPPYALVSITKRFGKPGSKPPKAGDAYARAASGFMGKQWDTGDRAFSVEFWTEAFRVLKPGGHVAAFGGTRTVHRLACAIEDAGFEIRDMVAWLYGNGLPKSHNIGNGLGTALKPAIEPITLARKPLIGTVAANVLAHGTGAINIDICRVGVRERDKITGPKRTGSIYRKIILPGGKLLPPSRWPANVVHDGSDEVLGLFPETQSTLSNRKSSSTTVNCFGVCKSRSLVAHTDSGSAARFFYSAKATAEDRIGSKHPTVKPVALMRWLCRLITPPGGLILDPFAGTGTTGQAAFYEGFRAILVEREAEYHADIDRRMAFAMAGPDERANAIVKAKGELQSAGPLFEGAP